MEKLILGTHTSDGEQNHLMIAEARIPTENAEIDSTKYQDKDGGKMHSSVYPPRFYSTFCSLTNQARVVCVSLTFCSRPGRLWGWAGGQN